MFRGNRDDRYALIALALILGSVVLVSIVEIGSEYLAQHYAANNGEHTYQGSNEDVRAILAALTEFDPLADTVAQWSMAAFALIATIASIGALIYLRLTLIESRRVGQAQVRAYLSVKSVVIGCDAENGSIEFGCSILNSGQTPSFKTYALVKISMFRDGTTFDERFFHEIGTIEVGENPAKLVNYVDVKISREQFDRGNAIHVQMIVKSRDVFDKVIRSTAFFMGCPPQRNGRVELLPSLDISNIPGGRLNEAEFVDLIPNWRKQHKK